jgi:hypothetical protein
LAYFLSRQLGPIDPLVFGLAGGDAGLLVEPVVERDRITYLERSGNESNKACVSLVSKLGPKRVIRSRFDALLGFARLTETRRNLGVFAKGRSAATWCRNKLSSIVKHLI